METLDEIAERIHEHFENRTAIRDRALGQSRTLTRQCSHAIRAAHRDERDLARVTLDEARRIVNELKAELSEHPDLFYAGYTQDALKEYVEANIVFALLGKNGLPTPEMLEVEYTAYLQGLAESAGELRRRCLDCLMKGQPQEAERLLTLMDDIYAVLVTMDYPDAITGGLRRLTDMVRGVTERTRGDLTISLQQQRLEASLRLMDEHLRNGAPFETGLPEASKEPDD